ncbi:MAG TPA: 4Fe-4S dicluster domain-containing protein [Anaeromyxobacteraceae bacterium]|nr:4Fe-4S dicluster domain-containing protein [Anaeromyxobacteraceae bacterium]
MPSRFSALAYLGYRALLAHPLKLLKEPGSGRERFLANYAPEGLLPTSEDERRTGEEASACIACGLCDAACDLAGAVPAIRALGLHATFRLYSKSSVELPWAAAALDACARCTGCEGVCPTGVPISRIVSSLRERLARYPARP